MKKCFIGILLFLTAICCFADQSFEEDNIKPLFGLYSYGFTYGPTILELYTGFKGFDIIPGVESRLVYTIGGGFYGDSYHRNELGEQVAYDNERTGFYKWGIISRIGIDIGLLYSDRLEKNFLKNYLYLKTNYNYNIRHENEDALIFSSGLPEDQGFWESSVIFGFNLNTIEFNKFTQTPNGVSADASVEWIPGFAMNSLFGVSDYYRINASFSGFYTLLEDSIVSIYIAERFIADFLFGSHIPAHAQRTRGGMGSSSAPGGSIRGVKSGSYDSNMKLINNFDIRFTFPTLISYFAIPELFAFVDIGQVDSRDYQFRPLEETFLTTGFGVIMNFVVDESPIPLDFGYYITYSFTDQRWNFFNLVLCSHHF